jgi:hypothetical protein
VALFRNFPGGTEENSPQLLILGSPLRYEADTSGWLSHCSELSNFPLIELYVTVLKLAQ